MASVVCATCGNKIIGAGLEALDQRFHPEWYVFFPLVRLPRRVRLFLTVSRQFCVRQVSQAHFGLVRGQGQRAVAQGVCR